MWGFNVSAGTDTHYVSGDNRPVIPLMHRTFDQWWFHGHKDFPPHPTDILQFPVGQTKTVEIACDKGATSYFASSAGSVSVQKSTDGNDVCRELASSKLPERQPCTILTDCFLRVTAGYPMSQYHTNGADDLGGCALAVSYNNNPDTLKPDDLVVFSVQHACVWTRFTDFAIPAAMPPCPDGKCLCSFNCMSTCAWIVGSPTLIATIVFQGSTKPTLALSKVRLFVAIFIRGRDGLPNRSLIFYSFPQHVPMQLPGCNGYRSCGPGQGSPSLWC